MKSVLWVCALSKRGSERERERGQRARERERESQRGVARCWEENKRFCGLVA